MFDPMLIEKYKAELLRYAKKSEPDTQGGEAQGASLDSLYGSALGGV